MKTKIFLIISLFLALTARIYANEIVFSTGTYAEVLAKTKAENKVLMIDFFTDWCKWCVELDKKVYTNSDVADFANNNQINWKIDADKGEGVELKKKFGVAGYPTVIFVNGDGEEIDRIVGYLPAKDFLSIMKDYNAGKNTLPSLKKILEINPDDIEANFKMGKKYSDGGDVEKAKPYLDKVVKLDPDNRAGWTDDAELLLAQISNKTEDLESFIKKYPNSEVLKQAYMSLAEISFGEKKIDKADEYYKILFDMYGKQDEDIKFGYGQLLVSKLYSISENKEAVQADWKKGIVIATECLDFVKGGASEGSCYYYMASFYNKLGDKTNAKECIEKAIKVHDKKAYRELQEKINK
ncbi:MAG: thioredoxin fold domain-containing protein [Ignavibacteria bacterium]|nr:thioredoxin fold domain-containing protein [Ignavibacteria bacterium]